MVRFSNHSTIKFHAQAQAKVAQKPISTSKMLLFCALSLATFLVATQLNAAENWYEKSYKAQNSGNLKSLQANPDTKMYVSNHKDEDDISMLESGYDMMGSSGFTAGDVSAEQALQHAKALKADTVLVYSKYGSAKTSASKLQLIKESAKLGKELTEKDMIDEQTDYNYYASYWAKLPAPLLGVHVIKLAKKEFPEDEKAIEIDGLKVIAVIKDSPAAKAGLVRGDMLLKFANNQLNKPEELSAIVQKNQGKEVAVEYERNGQKSVATAQINTRN